MKSLIYGTFAVSVVGVCVGLAAPEPVIVQGPGLWTVDTTFTHPQQIVLQLAGDDKPKLFWYMIVTLTNKTSGDVEFYPKCELMTDTFQIISASKDAAPAVFARIKGRHESIYPFLEDLEEAGNKILQGEDHTKDIAIVWPDFDSRAKQVKVFITGLSNETAAVDHPVAKDEVGEPAKIYLRKTLELSYDLRGDPALRSYASVSYTGKRWVMR
ncbi:MAG: hypothetical protein AMJ75_00915 [Phycisphaerae bacterium SM1_79]|nr:MAG: hypothetical protein AMJ75_00915 [Phycisphaerae bacterium SM1_79]